MASDAIGVGHRRMGGEGIFFAGKFVGVGSRQHVCLRAMVRAPACAGNIARAHFILGHASGAMAADAQVAFIFVEHGAIGEGHFARHAQCEIAVIVRRMAGETADLRRIGDEFLRVDLAGLGALNESFVGVTALAIVGIGITRVAKSPMAGGLVLAADAAHGKLRLRAMAIDAAFRKYSILRTRIAPTGQTKQYANQNNAAPANCAHESLLPRLT